MFYGQYEDVKDTFDILLAAAFVYVFAFERGKISALLRSRKLVLLGNVSMYIYLFHFPFRLILGTDLLHLNHNAYQFELDKCLLVVLYLCVYPKMKFNTKRTERMHKVQFNSCQRRVHNFMMTNDRIPRQMPSAIE